MDLQAEQRRAVVLSLIDGAVGRMLDVGSGPIFEDYPYAQIADHVTCLDWKLSVYGSPPDHVACVEGDLMEAHLPHDQYDLIIAADVFEHIRIEDESDFMNRCNSLLKPGGKLILTVPHRGTFHWLDPYEVKPAIGRVLWRLGLRRQVHNGFCDVRKGHKHYIAEELANAAKDFACDQAVYWGYLYDPLLSWAESLARKLGWFPGRRYLQNQFTSELTQDVGERSFNMAMRFSKLSG